MCEINIFFQLIYCSQTYKLPYLLSPSILSVFTPSLISPPAHSISPPSSSRNLFHQRSALSPVSALYPSFIYGYFLYQVFPSLKQQIQSSSHCCPSFLHSTCTSAAFLIPHLNGSDSLITGHFTCTFSSFPLI